MTKDESLLARNAPGPCAMSAVELAEAYAARRLSPVEAVTAVLERAEALNPTLNAFTHIDRAGAIEAARASERRYRDGAALGPLDGVPCTIKDIVGVRGWTVRFGSPQTPDTPCAEDAPVPARLRAAGAVLIGLTTSPEFGWKAVTDGPFSGVTRNPHDTGLTPGGSSGGAAAASAAGIAPLHLGTDGGGSIRIPASFTGTVGHKPAFGRVPAYPMSSFGTVAHLGPMARTVEDTALMLDAIAGAHPDDWYTLVDPAFDARAAVGGGLKGKRFGLWLETGLLPTEPETRAATEALAKRLEDAGASIVPCEIDAAELLDTFHEHWFAGAMHRLSGVQDLDRTRLDPGLDAVARAAEKFDLETYLKAVDRRVAFGRTMMHRFENLDAVLSPACAVLPFAAGLEVPEGFGLERWTEWAGFSFPINLTQLPATVIPNGTAKDGRPIGAQLIGPKAADAATLGLAVLVEGV